jgi:ribosomal protein S18 acetylase RimI-like enzyme
VLERARAEGRATTGATLFTNRDNAAAIALYEALGFEQAAPWVMAFLEAI